ncbi:YbfB/YjiJ family MFS transporter [Ideonella margarita]|uniref:YbfB/YjiJ family MFS transporter n=1 Tax=Ideonella margarita TaxID=2984191 RepID=A0ABU9C809_9BURK
MRSNLPDVTPEAAPGPRHGVWTMAMSLALASAVSLGLSRFAYALLLPAMRLDLGWSYATAGAMNTVNAAGYLLGALLMPRLLSRWDARRVVLGAGALAAVLLAGHGVDVSAGATSGAASNGGALWLYVLRVLLGVASAASFVGGGVLASQLALQVSKPGLVLGLYYGGTGLGIVASALSLPPLLAHAASAWREAWWLLAVLALLATAGLSAGTAGWRVPPPPAGERVPAPWRRLGWGLAGYLMFGLGYIGYMTFNVTLLREQGLGSGVITGFYLLVGLGVVASSWLWAGLLQRHADGRPMAVLNGLLAVATALAVLVPGQTVLALLSGALFGSVFLSVVASTTALVRHNLPRAAWASGITAFTVIFAAGQIIGPVLVGLLADRLGGLASGLWLSTGLLALGSLLASRQRQLG